MKLGDALAFLDVINPKRAETRVFIYKTVARQLFFFLSRQDSY